MSPAAILPNEKHPSSSTIYVNGRQLDFPYKTKKEILQQKAYQEENEILIFAQSYASFFCWFFIRINKISLNPSGLQTLIGFNV